MKNKMIRITTSAAGLALIIGSMACGDANAMAKKPIPQTEPVPIPTEVTGDTEHYQQGFELGHRNGTLMAERLRERTLGVGGCQSIDDYQRGLLAVSRTIRPPVQPDGLEPRDSQDIARGFFRGYIEAIRAAIQDSRLGCERSVYQSGEFPGSLYGAILCQVTKVDVSILSELTLSPLYAGWTGGATEVISQCRESAQIVIEQCGPDVSSVQSQLELLVQLSCND